MLVSRFLGAPLAVELTGELTFPDDLQARVTTIWQSALVERPNIHDGPIVSMVNLSAGRLVVARTTYRYLLATRKDAALRLALRLRPLAVSGILSCPDGLVFGRRARDVTQGPGLWELVPSGGIEPPADGSVPSLGAQILRELHEEVGLRPDQVIVRPPVGLIEDTESGLVDVAIPMATPLSAADVEAAHRRGGTGEYEELHITADPHVFLRTHADILEETRAILNAFGNLPAGKNAGGSIDPN